MPPFVFPLKCLFILCICIKETISLLTGNCTALITSYGFDAIQHLEVTDVNGVYNIGPTPTIPPPTIGDPMYLTTTLNPLDPNTQLSFHFQHAYSITQPNFIATIEVNCTDHGPCHYSTGPVNGFPYGPWSIYDPSPSNIYTMQYTLQSAITITNNVGYGNIEPNAVWVSNGQQFDQIDFLFNFSAITCETPTTTAEPTVDGNNCTAKICAHGDDSVTLDVSDDGGSTWNLGVASETNWQNTMIYNVYSVDADTILRFTVSDNGFYAGFLATVQLCGNNDYIWSFFTDQINTYFDVISDSSGDPLLDVFYEFGTGPWQSYVNSDDVECMNNDADWVWNDHNGNTMVFELNFAHHLDLLTTLECINETMPSDCCEYSLEEYLDVCYCDATPTTPAPTPATAPIHVLTAVEIREDIARGESVGFNMIKDGNDDNSLLYEKMDRIEYMIYATWMILFIQFIAMIFVVTNSKSCCTQKTQNL